MNNLLIISTWLSFTCVEVFEKSVKSATESTGLGKSILDSISKSTLTVNVLDDISGTFVQLSMLYPSLAVKTNVYTLFVSTPPVLCNLNAFWINSNWLVASSAISLGIVIVKTLSIIPTCSKVINVGVSLVIESISWLVISLMKWFGLAPTLTLLITVKSLDV